MGRGLAAILLAPPDLGGGEPASELRQVPLELIAPNPRQPRREFDEARSSRWPSRCASAACCSPCSCGPLPGGSYELIAGERRWRAAQLAGLETVPALVRPHDDAESLELALIENMAREDLNPVEEARACALLVEELGLTREDVGRRVGRSRVAVSNLLRLLDLPDEVLDLLGRRPPDRGPRPRAAHGLRPRRPPPARPRARSQEGWSRPRRPRRARARPARRRTPAPAAPRARAAPHPDQAEAAAAARRRARRGARRRRPRDPARRRLPRRARLRDPERRDRAGGPARAPLEPPDAPL